MNQWSLMDNPIINEANVNSRELPKVNKAYNNTLKTTVVRRPSNVYGSSTIYGNTFSFDIPREYDNLAQLHIVATITLDTTGGEAKTWFATKIFSEIVLQTKNGTRLMKIDPNYTAARLYEITGQQLYTCITANLDPAEGLPNAQFIVTVPLFFFFSEEIGNFLHTRKMEPLELHCVVNKDARSMGLTDAEVIGTEFELFLTYHDTNASSAFTDYPQLLNKNTKFFNKLYKDAKSYLFKVPKRLVGSFDIYSEQNFPVAVGQTYSKVYLKCNYPVYVMHISIVNSLTEVNPVIGARLTVGGSEIFDIAFGQNYSMYGAKHAYAQNSTFSYWFSIEQSRNRDSGLIIFSESMANTYLEVINDPIDNPDDDDGTYQLNITYECKTDLQLEDDGVVKTNKGFSRIRQQWNSLS